MTNVSLTTRFISPTAGDTQISHLRQKQVSLRLKVIADDEGILTEVRLGQSRRLRKAQRRETAWRPAALRKAL